MTKPTKEELEYEKLAGEVRSQKREPIKFAFWFVSAAAAIVLLWWQIPEQISKAKAAEIQAAQAALDLETARKELEGVKAERSALQAQAGKLQQESRAAESRAAKLEGEAASQARLADTLLKSNQRLVTERERAKEEASQHFKVSEEMRQQLDEVTRHNARLRVQVEQARGTLRSFEDNYLPTVRDKNLKTKFESLIDEGNRKLAPFK